MGVISPTSNVRKLRLRDVICLKWHYSAVAELRSCLTSKPITYFLLCHWFTRTKGWRQYSHKVLCLLGMGSVKRHVVEFRFLRLVRTKSSQKLILLKVCLSLEIGEDGKVSLEQQSSWLFHLSFQSLWIEGQNLITWWHSFDGLPPSELLAFKSSTGKGHSITLYPR